MIHWRDAFLRQHGSPNFQKYFGKATPAYSFRPLHYRQRLVAIPGTTGQPQNQNFPAGAIILGITAAGFQIQTIVGAFQYAPSMSPGRRDLFGLQFQYTADELIVSGGTALADALLGSGSDTIFPAREIVVAPSQGILATVEAFNVTNNMTVDIMYHCMVPRAVG